MKKFFLLLFAVGLYAESKDTSYLYVQMFGGPNIVQTEKTSGVKPEFYAGYDASLSLGYRCPYHFSLEAECAFRRNILSSLSYYGATFTLHGYYQSFSYMGNFIWEVPPSWGPVQPCLGVGIGYDVQHMRAPYRGFLWKNYENGFAWQLMALLRCPLPYYLDLSI